MAKIYRDINIRVGLGLYQTGFIGQVIEVQTENDFSRLLMSFPDSYADYAKLMDILYTSSEGTTVIETYGLTYDSDLSKYYFIIPRYITFGEILYIQFRARYIDEQEAVDPTILTLRFKNSLKKSEFDITDVIPDAYESVLQSIITAHAGMEATETDLGHVRVDNDTIIVSASGVISSTSGYSLPTASTDSLGGVKIDGTTVTINGSGVISAHGTGVGGGTIPFLVAIEGSPEADSADLLIPADHTDAGIAINAFLQTKISGMLSRIEYTNYIIPVPKLIFAEGRYRIATTITTLTNDATFYSNLGTYYYPLAIEGSPFAGFVVDGIEIGNTFYIFETADLHIQNITISTDYGNYGEVNLVRPMGYTSAMGNWTVTVINCNGPNTLVVAESTSGVLIEASSATFLATGECSTINVNNSTGNISMARSNYEVKITNSSLNYIELTNAQKTIISNCTIANYISVSGGFINIFGNLINSDRTPDWEGIARINIPVYSYISINNNILFNTATAGSSLTCAGIRVAGRTYDPGYNGGIISGNLFSKNTVDDKKSILLESTSELISVMNNDWHSSGSYTDNGSNNYFANNRV